MSFSFTDGCKTFAILGCGCTLMSVAVAENQPQNVAPSQGTVANIEKPDPTKALDSALHTPQSHSYYAILPEGKTLPKGVMRMRVPFRYMEGTTGYDKDGKKQNQGLSLHAAATAFVLEYGVTHNLSLQVVAPMVVRNNLSVNRSQFRASPTYKQTYNSLIEKLVAKSCPANTPIYERCAGAIRNGMATTKQDTPVMLTTGEIATIQKGQKLTQAVDNMIVNNTKQSDGGTGIGDVEVGTLYSLLNENGPFTGSPIYLAMGAGLRFPTGSFRDVPADQRPTGRGTLDAGFRTNLDYNPAPGVLFSWQNMTEVMLRKGEKKRASMIDPSKLNQADATNLANVQLGADGQPNTQSFERKGARNLGFLKAAWGLGNTTDVLKMVNLNAQWKYEVDAAEYQNHQLQNGGRKESYAVAGGIGLDGLAYSVPAQLDFDYEKPVAGKNTKVAPTVMTVTLKSYYQL